MYKIIRSFILTRILNSCKSKQWINKETNKKGEE